MIQVVYVDDEPDNPLTRMIANLLTTNGMSCELRLPPPDLADVANWDLDIFIIDFDLASAKVDDKLIGYSGNSLATEVRNKKPSCPIILVSRKDVISARGLHLTTGRSDLDLILYKNDILNNQEKTLQDILTLHDGYIQLIEIQDQPWLRVLDKLGAEQDERLRIREAFPPIEQGHHWYIPTTIEWIRTVLMGYPGILYNSLHAAARIGITEDAFLSDEVQKYFTDAEYKGLLAGFGKRWWADRLLAIAKQAMIDANIDGPVSEGFVQAYDQTKGMKLDMSRCVVDGEPIADQICYILQQPVKRQNSILYYPDARPPIMDAARVSIKAIRESDKFDEDLVEASSYDVVKEIWDMS